MTSKKTPTYRLRFFFDYKCGGCLWADNDAAYEKYDVGTIDSEFRDLNGNVIQEPRIKLPETTRQKVLDLDRLYCESLDWNDPGGPSLWDKQQWDAFHTKTRLLHKEISEVLGDDFEIIYKQE
jgi:hypothetical protein